MTHFIFPVQVEHIMFLASYYIKLFLWSAVERFALLISSAGSFLLNSSHRVFHSNGFSKVFPLSPCIFFLSTINVFIISLVYNQYLQCTR
jgi:hypothetical protein